MLEVTAFRTFWPPVKVSKLNDADDFKQKRQGSFQGKFLKVKYRQEKKPNGSNNLSCVYRRWWSQIHSDILMVTVGPAVNFVYDGRLRSYDACFCSMVNGSLVIVLFANVLLSNHHNLRRQHPDKHRIDKLFISW